MIIDGKAIAQKRLEVLKKKISDLQVIPKLAVILVGDDPASQMYVRMKKKKAEEAGIECEIIEFAKDRTDLELLERIKSLNTDKTIHGILVQLPIPVRDKWESERILETIDPLKDVDGLTRTNLSGISSIFGPGFYPATVKAVCLSLEQGTGMDIFGDDDSREGINFKENKDDRSFWKGKEIVIVGRSPTVGLPLAHLFLKTDVTLTVCNSKTIDLAFHTKLADILISATGVPHLINKDMVKPGAIVIDVGISKPFDSAQGKQTTVVGDVDFENVKEIASAITPVPGGIGPLTIACLLENVVLAARMQNH